MKYIFLDVDGVLNSDRALHEWYEAGRPEPQPDWDSDDYELSPVHISLLKKIVDATGAKIILSSSWRYGWEKWEETRLDRALGKFGLKIRNKTPDGVRMDVKDPRVRNWYEGGEYSHRYPFTTDRGLEILKYLEDHPAENYVVLDDEGWDIEQWIDADHFVHTTAWDGLTEEKVEEAIRKLNGGIIRND